MSYVPHSDADVRAMLATIGVTSLDDLFASVPAALRSGELKGIPEGQSEWDTVRRVSALAERDASLVCFGGAGLYDHYVPAPVDHILRRSEFYTAYTPYQAEVSQGTLQVIYEFQTMVCQLTGMDVSQASMYDGASAFGEAVRAAVRVTACNCAPSRSISSRRRLFFACGRFSVMTATCPCRSRPAPAIRPACCLR